MLNRTKARVSRILVERVGLQEVLVEIGDSESPAINYIDLSGSVTPGDWVLVNTTAIDLNLGTGGTHFVICNVSRPTLEKGQTAGHIMKLRYTPLQTAVMSVEEDSSPHKKRIQEFESLYGMPVVCCELHSQIAPVAAAFKAITNHKGRIAYIMTDGAALPISLSRTTAELKEKGFIDATITCGQAFGGEIEAINLYTALIAAKTVADADIAIVSQGPGNAGTGSQFGFSGIEQGEAVNAAGILGGLPIAVLRISFADPRKRHKGLSHHTQTVLSKVALQRAHIAIPELPEDRAEMVEKQLAPIIENTGHNFQALSGELGLTELAKNDIRVRTMDRSIEDDREFFLSASAAGILASELLKK